MAADDCRNRSKGNIWMLRRVLGGGRIVRAEIDGGIWLEEECHRGEKCNIISCTGKGYGGMILWG